MPGLDGERSEQTRPRKHPPARPRDVRVKDELSEAAIRAMEEGCADHAVGRTFTLSEIKRELRIGSLWYTDFTDTGGATVGAHDE